MLIKYSDTISDHLQTVRLIKPNLNYLGKNKSLSIIRIEVLEMDLVEVLKVG